MATVLIMVLHILITVMLAPSVGYWLVHQSFMAPLLSQAMGAELVEHLLALPFLNFCAAWLILAIVANVSVGLLFFAADLVALIRAKRAQAKERSDA